jgi:IS30 family transposase
VIESFKRAIEDAEVNSITLDNGSEFARHREISARHNAPVYFPHSPWQRGHKREHERTYPVLLSEGHGFQ